LTIVKNNKIVINANNLTKSFGEIIAVNNISFEIHEGEIVGILGPNGAGKTTTLRLLTGVFKLEGNAKVEIYGLDLSKNLTKCKSKFGIVPEVSNAYSDYTVEQNLIFSGRIYGLSKEVIQARSEELLKRFELTGKRKSRTKTLSKGLKQRLNLCLALLHDPPILILDEPTSGLDPFSVKILRDQILKLKRENKTILMSTHDMIEAQTICDRILIMNRGKIIADEHPDTLRKDFNPSLTISFKIEGEISKDLMNEMQNYFTYIKIQEDDSFKITTQDVLEDLHRLYNFVRQRNLEVLDMKLKETSLEEVFINLVKSDLNGEVTKK